MKNGSQFEIQQPDYFFIRSKNNNKNCQEMGLLSLSNLEICIKMQNGQPIAPILNTTPEQTAFWQKVKSRLDGR